MCITRPHCANIAMILAGTSSQSRKHHVNQTRVHMSSRNPGGVVCFHHGTVPCQNVTVFNTRAMTGFVSEKTRGWLPPCQPSLVKGSLSDLGGLVFITKNIQHERSKDHHWDHHIRTNTSGQYTLECHSAKCVCVYPETTQCNICKDNR